MRLLLVDDEAMILAVVSDLLTAKGYEVRSALSAEEALAILDRESFDVILTDNVLPGMSGLRAIAEFSKRSRAPVLLMSGRADTETEKDAELLGAKLLLSKPLDMDVLDAVIRRLIRKGDGA